MPRIDEFETELERLIREEFSDLSYEDLIDSLEFYTDILRKKSMQ